MASSWRGRKIMELIVKTDESQRKDINDASESAISTVHQCTKQDTNDERNHNTKSQMSLVPNYDDESSSDSDENNTNRPAPVTRKATSTSSSSSSTSSASSSSSSSTSSLSSEIPQSEPRNQHQTHEIDVINSTPESEHNKITTAQEDGQVDAQCESNSRHERICATNRPIVVSPQYTDESDFDDDIADPTYNSADKLASTSHYKKKNYLFPLHSNHSSSDTDSSDQITKKGRKRQKRPNKWKQNRAKKLRNEGESYRFMSKSNKVISARFLKLPCVNCKLNCSQQLDDRARYDIFNNFWKLGDLSKQRLFINSCMIDIHPKYKYTNAENPRRPNKAFFLTVNDRKIRVCKTFFKNTLDITDRMIHTVKTNTNENGFVLEERRGKHGHNKKISPQLAADIKKHIDSIPRMESHYLRAQITKEYIGGGKTIKDLYRDFSELQSLNGKDSGKYITYYKIFTTEYNISFFSPKKDQCDLCTSYENSDNSQKIIIESKYKNHLKEKELSRTEKLNDRMNADNDNKVVVYDLEAVLQCPRGDTSAFYYKSKINSYNLTMTELNNKDTKSAYDNVQCYFWTEIEAKRGAIEIGTCVWEFLKKISCEGGIEGKNVIFYSDNCGQNKNKYIATLYLYAVQMLNINSITHKFLIRGHTQNEADSVHSLIEKEVKKNLKSGPIYTPDQYVALIKSAKKCSPPINVHEMTYNMFVDLKNLQEEWGYNYTIHIDGETVNWNEIKQLKMCKGNPFTFYYKNSYEDESFKEVNVRNKRKKMKTEVDILLEQAYTERQTLSANKKKDLKGLRTKGLIPSYYDFYYNTIL